MRTAASVLMLSLVVGPLAHADINAKIARIQNETARARASWKATKSALRSLRANKPLRAALGARSQFLVLGERSGSYVQPSTAYSKSLHFGLSEFTGYMGVKVKWKEQLVLGSRGLEVRKLRSVSKPTEASVRAFQADLDAQFAKKPDTITMPKTKVAYEPYGDYGVVKSRKARLGWFGLGSTRLKAETWGHVTPTQIESAVQSWGSTP